MFLCWVLAIIKVFAISKLTLMSGFNFLSSIFRADLVKGEWNPAQQLVELEKEMVINWVIKGNHKADQIIIEGVFKK